MERKIDKFLEQWQKDSERKPLLIYGSKQVGKTYSVLNYGYENYDNVVYIDSNENTKLFDYVKKETTIDGIVLKLEKYSMEKIEKKATLVVFDNVHSVELVNIIKTFGKFKNDYHIILITSLKDNLSSFKGIELQFKSVLPMDFEEFLIAINKSELIDYIKNSFKHNKKNPFHNISMDYFQDYLLTGGMPEAVHQFIQNENKLLLNSTFDKIIDTYLKEIGTQENLIDITRSVEVYNSVPLQLLKDNKKFMYGLIKEGGRSKEYENSLNFLHNNAFVYKCYRLNDVKSPLSSYRDLDSFKVYMNDTGILFKKLKASKLLVENTDEYMKILYENSVAVSLISNGYNLYYYQSSGKAFIDFVIQTKAGYIIPIEITASNKSKSKSLSVFNSKYNPSQLIRISGDNFSLRRGIRCIPVYATFCLSELI